MGEKLIYNAKYTCRMEIAVCRHLGPQGRFCQSCLKTEEEWMWKPAITRSVKMDNAKM